MQKVPNHEEASDIATSFCIEKARWHKSVRDAIDASICAEMD
jgi:hypothetical protein